MQQIRKYRKTLSDVIHKYNRKRRQVAYRYGRFKYKIVFKMTAGKMFKIKGTVQQKT